MKVKLRIIVSTILSLLLISCKGFENGVINVGKDSAIAASRVSIRQLAKDLSEMDGKYVEVKGRFAYNFEDVALYDYGFFSDSRKCFWLDFSPKISGSAEILHTLSGKIVSVKGRVNAQRHGHLGYYLATLQDVYFMVQK